MTRRKCRWTGSLAERYRTTWWVLCGHYLELRRLPLHAGGDGGPEGGSGNGSSGYMRWYIRHYLIVQYLT